MADKTIREQIIEELKNEEGIFVVIGVGKTGSVHYATTAMPSFDAQEPIGKIQDYAILRELGAKIYDNMHKRITELRKQIIDKAPDKDRDAFLATFDKLVKNCEDKVNAGNNFTI